MNHNFRELSKRANINTYSFSKKPIIIYEDHRYILNVFFYLLKEGLVDQPIDLIYFDYHDDFGLPSKAVKQKAKNFNLSKFDTRDFFPIVEFDLSTSDDDWVIAGMEFGLINDAVVIGAQEKNNSKSKEVYTDTKGKNHIFYRIKHLSNSLGTRGSLGDATIVDPFYEEIRNFFNYDYSQGYQGKDYPFFLDFDLDYFSERFKENRIAWPKSIIDDEFFSSIGHQPYYTPYDFILDLHSDSLGVTICKESKCCGGMGEANKILEYLDINFFNETLNTKHCT